MLLSRLGLTFALTALVLALSTTTVLSVHGLEVEEMNEMHQTGSEIKASLRLALEAEAATATTTHCATNFTWDGILPVGAPVTQPEQREFMLTWCMEFCTQQAYCPYDTLVEFPPTSLPHYTCVCQGVALPAPTSAPTHRPTHRTPSPTPGAASDIAISGATTILLGSVLVALALY